MFVTARALPGLALACFGHGTLTATMRSVAAPQVGLALGPGCRAGAAAGIAVGALAA